MPAGVWHVVCLAGNHASVWFAQVELASVCTPQELSGKPVLDLSLATVSKLLRALNECTEWGQVRCAVGGC